MTGEKMVIAGCLVVLCGVLLLPTSAYAYVDPGSAGYLFQILFVIFSAAVGAIAFGKNKLIQFFQKLLKLKKR